MGKVIIWDPKTARPGISFQAYETAVRTMVLTADGRTLVTGGGDGSIKVWSLGSDPMVEEPVLKHTLKDGSADITSLSLAEKDLHLVSGDADGYLNWWDMGTGRKIRDHQHRNRAIRTATYSPPRRSSKLLIVYDFGKVQFWDWEKGRTSLRPLGHDG